jgi:hypothetical protein
MLPYSIRNLSPDSDRSEPTSCEKCEKLASQLSYLNNWIRETENPKMRKQLEKAMEGLKGTVVLHRFEQHSKSQMPHPVRSGLSRPQSLPRPRLQTAVQEKLAELKETK